MLLSHEQQYEAAWADLRMRGYIALAGFLAFGPGMVLSDALIGLVYTVNILWVGAFWQQSSSGHIGIGRPFHALVAANGFSSTDFKIHWRADARIAS
jgi:hypothetical protein